jgi:hypothetical protein
MKLNRNIQLSFLMGLLGICTAFAQEKQFDLVVGGGYYSTPARKPVSSRGAFNAEFEYHHGRRWSFAAGILTTEYWYHMDESSTTTLAGIPVNRGNELQSNFVAKYKILDNSLLTIQLGAGAGLITMGQDIETNTPTSSSTYHTSYTDLGFPLVAESYVKLSRHVLVGVKLGSFVFPDYPIIGNNASLQIRYRL